MIQLILVIAPNGAPYRTIFEQQMTPYVSNRLHMHYKVLLLPGRHLAQIAALIASMQAAQQQLALQSDMFTLQSLVTCLQQNKNSKKEIITCTEAGSRIESTSPVTADIHNIVYHVTLRISQQTSC